MRLVNLKGSAEASSDPFAQSPANVGRQQFGGPGYGGSAGGGECGKRPPDWCLIELLKGENTTRKLLKCGMLQMQLSHLLSGLGFICCLNVFIISLSTIVMVTTSRNDKTL
jgi:hypothetical protein